jgi:hypothetical protein
MGDAIQDSEYAVSVEDVPLTLRYHRKDSADPRWDAEDTSE